MNKLTVVLILATIISAQGMEHTTTWREDIQQAQVNLVRFEYSLYSDYEGILVASMRNIVDNYRYHPSLKYNTIVDRLNYLIIHAESFNVRHKAYVTAMYLENPHWFDCKQLDQVNGERPTDDEYFTRLFSCVTVNLFSAS